MANTLSKVCLQFVFAGKCRQCLLPRKHKEELHRYITRLVQNRKTKMLAIYCMPDHVHLFVGFNPVISIADFVKEIKVESNEFINAKYRIPSKFNWQEGYGVFSYSHSHIDSVIKYILDQEIHHKRNSFRHEYHQLLQKFDIPFKKKYLFEFLDNSNKDL